MSEDNAPEHKDNPLIIKICPMFHLHPGDTVTLEIPEGARKAICAIRGTEWDVAKYKLHCVGYSEFELYAYVDGYDEVDELFAELTASN